MNKYQSKTDLTIGFNSGINSATYIPRDRTLYSVNHGVNTSRWNHKRKRTPLVELDR